MFFTRSTVAVMLTVIIAGCGGPNGPQLATVSGTVTLDGQPLNLATVEFSPTAPGGSSSSGRTDASGRYELMYLVGKPGAVPGKYVVRITTWRQEHVPGGTPRVIPELVPSHYNSDSKVVRDVASESNTLNFELVSSSKDVVSDQPASGEESAGE